MEGNPNIYSLSCLDYYNYSHYAHQRGMPIPAINGHYYGNLNHRISINQSQRNKNSNMNVEMVHKVKVPHGAIWFDTKWIISMIHLHVEKFKPILPTENENGDFLFYIRDDDTAGAIRALNLRIYNRVTKTKIQFQVSKVSSPWKKLSKQTLNTINNVIAKRYNAEQETLDLSAFGDDEDFKSQTMSLTNGNVMLAVANRIDKKYADLTGLNLSNNRLNYLDHVSSLVPIVKSVKVLDLSNNMIANESELRKLAGMRVEHLLFEGNPILKEFASDDAYLKLVQKTFPKCSKLDGNDVPPLENKLEDVYPIRPGFLEPGATSNIIKRFIEKYYNSYDGENGRLTRKELAPKYDEQNATFTLSIANLNGAGKQKYTDDGAYATYARASHNLVAFKEDIGKTRENRIVRGSKNIILALSKLPITKHHRDSFVVDVFLNAENLVGFTVQGLFEDSRLSLENRSPSLNFFLRTFLVSLKEDESVVVISDQLLISSASANRLERYKGLMEQAGRNGPPLSDEYLDPESESEPSMEIKEQLIDDLAEFSGMNRAYSEKCLSDLKWVYENACAKFLEYKDIIPAKAFIQD